MGSSPFSFPLPKYLGSVFGLEEEASRRIKQGKEGVESGYLVPDLVPALWEASWCHISQPPDSLGVQDLGSKQRWGRDSGF